MKTRSTRMPDSVLDVKAESLQTWQRYVMADWLGCRNLNSFGKTVAERNAFLDRLIKDNPEKAQTGYELIVLRKEPSQKVEGGVNPEALAEGVSARLVSAIRSALEGFDAQFEERAKEALAKSAIETMAALEDYAKTALDKAAKEKAPIKVQTPDKKIRTVKGVLPPEFERMVQLASARIPILLVGPAGCGKTYLCEKLAEALGLEFSDQSCSEGMSESVFNGRLLPIGAGGAFQHVASPFMERYEKGGVMLLDEIDAGDPNLFTYINKAVANSSYTVEQRWKKPVVKKHADFVLVAAANTFGNGADAMYVGRNQLDAATMDRFRVGLITMDYNQDVEKTLASSELCEWAWKVRSGIRANKLRRIMSTRVIKDLGTMERMYGWSRAEWEAAYFADWSEADRNAIASYVS